MQNVEVLNGVGAGKENDVKIVATCPHCYNTIANEYPQLGGHYEVVHHTQLLGKLLDDGHLKPVAPVEGRSPTTTPATWAGTTGSTPRRARSSTPSTASRPPR
jgi:Fe-S oxidoreductase